MYIHISTLIYNGWWAETNRTFPYTYTGKYSYVCQRIGCPEPRWSNNLKL